jgi:hypothetical protein
MVGAILALAIGDHEIEAHWYRPIGLLASSMACFIWGLEKSGEAMDEDDVNKYLAWLLAYNLGTIAMFFGIATYIALHYHSGWKSLAVIFGAATVASSKWIYDTFYLLFQGEHDYEVYREELLGRCPPGKERDWLMKAHGFFRGLRKHERNDPLPDTESFTRLQPSPVHGVGVFAIRDIPKGTNIFKDDRSEMTWIDEKEVSKKSEDIKRLYGDFCVLRGGRYGCPKGFNNLTVAWYINEPPKGQEPNVVCGDEYDFFAARDIRVGEELTVDYSTYSDDPLSGNGGLGPS